MELHPADPSMDNVYQFAEARGAGPRPGGSDHSATMEAAPVVVGHGGQSGGNGAPATGSGPGAGAGADTATAVDGAEGGSGPGAQAASTPTAPRSAAPKGAKLRPRRRARIRLAHLLQA